MSIMKCFQQNRNEIGSDFYSIPICDNKNTLFSNVTWFISGRSALRAILKQIHLDFNLDSYKVALPSFLCESMIEPLEIEKIKYSFYDVKINNGLFDFDFSKVIDCDVFLIMDYFGYKSNYNLGVLKNKIIIRDLTHSVFISKYSDADYYFGSLRKWAGFIGAGFALKNGGNIKEADAYFDKYIEEKKKAMELKIKYISCQTESKEYLVNFKVSEAMLNPCDIYMTDMSDVTAAQYLDIQLLKDKRRENAKVLTDSLNEYCLIKRIGENDCPLCVPIVCNRRDELRNYLISLGIYCPIHWPKPSQVSNNLSKELYEKELSLVCDQRYNKDDMNRIVNAIKLFMEK